MDRTGRRLSNLIVNADIGRRGGPDKSAVIFARLEDGKARIVAQFTTHDHEVARMVAASLDTLTALEDCRESLSRLEDSDGAYRVTCIEEARQALASAHGDRDYLARS